jgi:mannitol-1-phosphate 5-dehydrogenase
VLKTFVGIGFGPIQSGLFLLEAHASKNFGRLVVAEVIPETVAAVRRSGGQFNVNVASRHGIETHEVGGVEIHNPLYPADAARLIDAIAEAAEIATALPSVDFFGRGKPSPAELLARGLKRKFADAALPHALVYAAENHNRAAEILRHAVLASLDDADRRSLDRQVQFVNTVIGKMSGVVNDPAQIERDSLVPLVQGGNQAVLVEEFNRILISQIKLPDFRRGINVFEEKPDLLPFEEAKLYGHNAAHALLGYLSHRERLTFIHDAHSAPLFELVRCAFLEESGGALCRRHKGVDPLFTLSGWEVYAQDLLERMVNPYLRDRVDRVIRDPQRKLGWDDRLIGTMRRAIEAGIAPQRYAAGAAAAAELLLAGHPEHDCVSLLHRLWQDSTAPLAEQNELIDHILRAARDPTFMASGK